MLGYPHSMISISLVPFNHEASSHHIMGRYLINLSPEIRHFLSRFLLFLKLWCILWEGLVKVQFDMDVTRCCESMIESILGASFQRSLTTERVQWLKRWEYLQMDGMCEWLDVNDYLCIHPHHEYSLGIMIYGWTWRLHRWLQCGLTLGQLRAVFNNNSCHVVFWWIFVIKNMLWPSG